MIFLHTPINVLLCLVWSDLLQRLPERKKKLYQTVFSSIDKNNIGYITPSQLAAGDVGGITDIDGLGWHGKSLISFEDFVGILQRAEKGRATRLITKLLEDKGQGQGLRGLLTGSSTTTIAPPPSSSRVDTVRFENSNSPNLTESIID